MKTKTWKTLPRNAGFTLMELLIATALASLMLTAIAGLVGRVVDSQSLSQERNSLNADARFAMDRLMRAARETRKLVLPMPDKPATNWRENVREETVPASSPEGSSAKATAVLAVSLSKSFDLDANGVPDADNDGDGRFDEDPTGDLGNDFETGIIGIDDDGDGLIDEAHSSSGPDEDDDDEDGTANEDGWNDVDDDSDNQVDEDPKKDMNGDGQPGIGGVDDDGDGDIDEGDKNDDDEDGSVNEDWLDAHVFFLQGGSLIERVPVPWDENVDGTINGRDYVDSVIAENVTLFRVERPAASANGVQLVYLTLELTSVSGERVTLDTRVRVGAGQ